MKTAKDIGLVAAILSLISGLSFVLNYVWVFILISVGLWRQATWPFAAPVWFLVVNMVVYVSLSIEMIPDRRTSFFLLAALWAIASSALAVYVGFSMSPLFNLLSFLIVFSSTYYYLTKTDVARSRNMTLLAGSLALIQGGLLTFGIIFLFWVSLSGSWVQGSIPPSSLVGMVVYLALGVGIVIGYRRFLLYVALWTVIESVLALFSFYFERGSLFTLLSMLILFLSTYNYWAKQK
jgi:hypothetical protein